MKNPNIAPIVLVIAACCVFFLGGRWTVWKDVYSEGYEAGVLIGFDAAMGFSTATSAVETTQIPFCYTGETKKSLCIQIATTTVNDII